MKRRLRKKRHAGEFVEHGFSITAVLRPPPSDKEDRFLDELIDFVVPLGLGIGGGSGPTSLDVFATGYDFHRCSSLSFPPRSYRGPIGRRSVAWSKRTIPEKKHGARDPDEGDRLSVEGFLSQHPRVERFEVGPLVDAWRTLPEEDGAAPEVVETQETS